MAGLSDTLPIVENRGKVQKKERKKERTNERNILQLSNNETSSFGNVAASCVIGTTFTHYHSPTPFSTASPSIPLPLPPRFFETRPFLVSCLENPIIQTQRASSSKLVETDPVFVADGHEVCRVVLLRELCKCRTQTLNHNSYGCDPFLRAYHSACIRD